MAWALGFGAISVIVLVVAVIGVFLWQLARGALGDDVRTFRMLHRAAWAATVLLLAAAAVTVVADLVSPLITITVPIRHVWPLPLAGVDIDTGPAHVESAEVALAQLTLSGLSLPVRLLWTASQALSLLLPASVAFLVARGAALLRDGAPFSPVLARTTGTAALIVLLAGSIAPVLGGTAGSMASHEALQVTSAAWSGGYPDDWSPQDVMPEPTVFVPFEFWPLGVAVALLVVTAILRYGARLQKDTEGLV